MNSIIAELGAFVAGSALTWIVMTLRQRQRRTRDILMGYKAGQNVLRDDGDATPGAPGPGPSLSDW